MKLRIVIAICCHCITTACAQSFSENNHIDTVQVKSIQNHDSVSWARICEDIDSFSLFMPIREGNGLFVEYDLMKDEAVVIIDPLVGEIKRIRLGDETKYIIAEYVYYLFVAKDSILVVSTKNSDDFEHPLMFLKCFKNGNIIVDMKEAFYKEEYSQYFYDFLDTVYTLYNRYDPRRSGGR